VPQNDDQAALEAGSGRDPMEMAPHYYGGGERRIPCRTTNFGDLTGSCEAAAQGDVGLLWD